MENRLKERLTGAAILVALIVILVPQMFRGQGGGTTAASSSSSSGGEGAPIRSYTIDLSNNPKRSAPVQSTNESAEAVPAAPTPAQTANPILPAPATLAPPPPAQPPPAPPPAPPATASAVHVAKVATTPPSSAPPSPPASTGAAKAAANAGWSVQLGLFAKRENAERQMNDAKARGIAVSISSADAKGMFHVRVSGLADRASAQAMEQKLKAQGLPAAVVPP